MKFFLFIWLFISSLILSQTITIVGKITDHNTGQPIPFVNIGVENTLFGTSANELGEFKISLSKEYKNFLISCVGYETKRIKIPQSRTYLNIVLTPITIELPEVLINADENPAYAIIRKAIANKEKNKEGLKNYFYDFYSKNIFNSGNEIVFLEEDIGEGLKTLPNDVKEIKNKISHTENISEEIFSNSDLNFFEKKIVDFTDDSLTLGKFVFHLPISKFAFDYYDYKLLGIKQSGNRNYYQIQVIPYSKIRPTFKGEILIDDSCYALAGLDLTLESRNLMPFTEIKISVFQNIIKYRNYWLPKYYNIDVQTYINYYNLVSLDSAITSYVKVFNNFKINLNKDDPLLGKINRLDDTSFHPNPESISINQMDSLRLYPQSLKETNAYKTIDSTKDILSSLKLGGIGGEYIKNAEITDSKSEENNFDIFTLLEYLNLQNNRVDGINVGLKYSKWPQKKIVKYSVKTAYSFVRKDINADASFYIPAKNILFDGIEISGQYKTNPLNVFSPYSDFMNSAAVTLGFDDQFNYYRSTAGSLSLKKLFNKSNSLSLGYSYEYQKSQKMKKYYSLFNLRNLDRINPAITNGYDNKISLTFLSGKSPFDFNLVTEDGLIAQVDLSSKSLGSDFNYTRINAAYQFYIKTFFRELFFSPYLGVLIEGSAISGSYGPQHLYSPQTALGIFSPFGTFKGLFPYQFAGNRSLALHLNHNWRKTFFDMLGIYFPVSWNIELTTGLSFLQIWNSNKISNFYWEAYGGISGILGFLSANVVYNKYKKVYLRIGVSKFI